MYLPVYVTILFLTWCPSCSRTNNRTIVMGWMIIDPCYQFFKSGSILVSDFLNHYDIVPFYNLETGISVEGNKTEPFSFLAVNVSLLDRITNYLIQILNQPEIPSQHLQISIFLLQIFLLQLRLFNEIINRVFTKLLRCSKNKPLLKCVFAKLCFHEPKASTGCNQLYYNWMLFRTSVWNSSYAFKILKAVPLWERPQHLACPS